MLKQKPAVGVIFDRLVLAEGRAILFVRHFELFDHAPLRIRAITTSDVTLQGGEISIAIT